MAERTPKKDKDLPGQANFELTPAEADTEGNQTLSQLSKDPSQFFEQAMGQTRMAICITDPHQDGNPITFVNQAFLELTGYERDEVLGRNCSFLQGKETAPEAIKAIREALNDEKVVVVELLNYRKDGTKFWNALHVGPIYDDDGNLKQFYGSQWDVTKLIVDRERSEQAEQIATELEHRTANLFAVIQSIVNLSGRNAADVESLRRSINDRIVALGQAHKISVSPGLQSSDLHTLVETILRPYRTGCEGRVQLGGPSIKLPPDSVTPLGLALHEMATNALKYGALCEVDGNVSVHWERDKGTLKITWDETGGPKISDGAPTANGTGSRIIEGVLAGASGSIAREWRETGLRADIVLPLRSSSH